LQSDTASRRAWKVTARRLGSRNCVPDVPSLLRPRTCRRSRPIAAGRAAT
jgi:hypothetical protein